MIESERPREEPEGLEQTRGRGRGAAGARWERHPAAEPAVADAVRPLPSHLGQIHFSLGWDAVSGHENVLL